MRDDAWDWVNGGFEGRSKSLWSCSFSFLSCQRDRSKRDISEGVDRTYT